MMSEMPSGFLFFLFFFFFFFDRSKLFSVPSLIPFQFIGYSTHSKVVLSDDLS